MILKSTDYLILAAITVSLNLPAKNILDLALLQVWLVEVELVIS